MAIDLSTLADASSTANSLANLILVTPATQIGILPQQNTTQGSLRDLFIQKPQSFLFHYEGENTVTLESEVTDHFVENNTTIQDHVGLKPEIIKVTGYIGELNNVPPPGLAALKSAADRLALLSPFTPELSISALQAYETAALSYATSEVLKNAAVNTFNTFAGSPPVQNKQQEAFSKFYAWFMGRQLFKVQTPWAVFENMIILSIRSTQEEDTRVISSFDVTFKKLRFASTFITKPKKVAGRRGSQRTILADNGSQSLTNDTTKPLTNASISGIV